MAAEGERLTGLRDRLAEQVLGRVKEAWINGSMERRLPGNLNFGFKYVEGESLLLFLDTKGICVSTGSACSSHKLEPSHVLLSLGLKPEECHGSLRITLGASNTSDEVEYVAESIAEAVERFRGYQRWEDDSAIQMPLNFLLFGFLVLHDRSSRPLFLDLIPLLLMDSPFSRRELLPYLKESSDKSLNRGLIT